MRLFGSNGRKPDWICINVLPERVDVCHVRAAGKARPEILLCDSYRKEGGDAATLGRLRRELRLDRYHCTTLLKGGDYQIVQVEAPDVPEPEVKSAVRWRIKDMIDYPVETATVDAVFVPAEAGAAGHARQMLAVAAKNDLIAASIKPFNDADIPLEVIDIPEFAQRNLAHRLELAGRGLALLALDERGGLLTFTCDGELYQHRRIEVSLTSFAAAGPEERKALYDRLVLELQRSLDHFDRQFRHITVARVMVTPVPGADDLREHLAAGLDVPVALVHLSEIMDFPHIPELHEEARQAQCLQLIGAALREEAAA
ncbi:MAG: agglutinin biogenesis protein MshI [Betaproteobacteria bacterium]|nr:agglutinin biogenesis protein MshI [Betaproteobacteria bacterium]